jgi:hypothetical protein
LSNRPTAPIALLVTQMLPSLRLTCWTGKPWELTANAAKVAMAAHSTTGVPSRRGRTKMRRKTYPPLRERHDRHPAGNAAGPAGRHESHNRDFRPAGRQNGNIQV